MAYDEKQSAVANGSFSFFITLHVAVHNLGFVCKVPLWMGRTKTNIVITKDEHVAFFPLWSYAFSILDRCICQVLFSCMNLWSDFFVSLLWSSMRKLSYELIVLFCAFVSVQTVLQCEQVINKGLSCLLSILFYTIINLNY